MKKFFVIYTAPASYREQMQNSSPDDMKKGMEQWEVWAKKCGNGLVDMGTPLGGGKKINQVRQFAKRKECCRVLDSASREHGRSKSATRGASPP